MKFALIVFTFVSALFLAPGFATAQFVEELKIDSTQVPEVEDQKMWWDNQIQKLIRVMGG